MTVANSIAFVYLRVSFPFIILTFYISYCSSKKVKVKACTGLLKLQLFKADFLMAYRQIQGDSAPKGYLYQASGISKGRELKS